MARWKGNGWDGRLTEDLILGGSVHFGRVCSEVCVGGLLVWVEWWFRWMVLCMKREWACCFYVQQAWQMRECNLKIWDISWVSWSLDILFLFLSLYLKWKNQDVWDNSGSLSLGLGHSKLKTEPPSRQNLMMHMMWRIFAESQLCYPSWWSTVSGIYWGSCRESPHGLVSRRFADHRY